MLKSRFNGSKFEGMFRRRLGIVFGLCLMFSFGTIRESRAAYLLLQEVSAESVGQAGATTAAGGRPSTQYANASNISYLNDELWLEAALTLYLPTSTYTNNDGQSTDSDVVPKFAPHVYASYKPIDWLAVGLAVFPNYGKILEWPENWEGGFDVVQNSVSSITINPNVSFGPFEGFSFAAGFDVVWSHIVGARNLTVGTAPTTEDSIDNRMSFKGQGWCWGANAGLSYQPTDWLRFGAGYRSSVTLVFDGKMDFDAITPWAWRFPDQDFHLEMVVPHQVSFGVRAWLWENFSMELDAWYFSWSQYKTLNIQMENGLYEGPTKIRMDDVTPQNLHDGYQVSLGAELGFLEHYTVRSGVAFDGNVLPDSAVGPIQPDNHRINVAAGFGVEWDGFFADAGYMLSIIVPRDVPVSSGSPLPGKYDSFKHAGSISIGYHFDPFNPRGESQMDSSEL